MRALAVVLLLGAALGPERADAQVLWVQPAPMFLLGPSLKESLRDFQLRSLSAGANVPVAGKELVFELQLAPGATPDGCGKTWFWGGWAAAGVLFPLGRSLTDGFFIQPKLTGSYFDQRQEGDRCVDAGRLRWSSVEWGLGIDIGMQATLGPLYAAPVIGAYVGQCINCPSESRLLAPYSPYMGRAIEPLARLSFGLNLNLLRVGFVF